MTSPETRKNRRGRDARVKARLSGAEYVNPCPPGQQGGTYRPLSETDINNIWRTALRILDEIGMADAPADVCRRAIDAGARINGLGRLSFPPALVEDIVAGAAKSFILYGRDSSHDIEIGGNSVFFGTGGAAEQVLDRESGIYRPSTLADLYDFARLADRLENVSWFSRCCVATDILDPFERDLNTAYAVIAGTRKPVGTSFALAGHVDPVIDMFDIALGGKDTFRTRPFCKAHVSPVISPLRYDADGVGVLLAAIRRGMPVNAIVAAQAGATAPATLAGSLAHGTAEALAALTLINIYQPGHPTVFSNWPLVTDLRFGSLVTGGAEMALMNAAAAQIGNWLGLPTGVAAATTDSKAIDAQMGEEKAISSLSAGLAGANLVYGSAGTMASLRGASLDALVADDEMLSLVQRTVRGIEVTDETLGFEAIRGAVTGIGHFLGSPHTMAAMQRDYFYPALGDRLPPEPWEQAGKYDLAVKAGIRTGELLSAHYPDHLGRADTEIRDRYRISLPRDRMMPQT